MTKMRIIVALGMLLLAEPLAAQDSAAAVGAEDPAARVETQAQAQPEAPAVAGLPRRVPQPRTMASEWPVYAGFSLTWIGIVAYMLLIGRRSRRVADAVTRLEGVER